MLSPVVPFLIPHLPRRPEAAIALRQRLNEAINELDNLKKDHTQLEVQSITLSKELTIAKSDCLSSAKFVACR
jgi:hypothetical protein